ncbi:sugar phosphate isomerase/epimerase [Paenibacillus sp. UMB4589-SE434]|nr:sugar phosphate isomerase/epimerase [Paenibacillus sp. UMB4589-SE434]MDK8183689.1 sugar phosphate isomerase/epimerase [Paenibacillus sp. UMB4589-SE434]
MTNTNTLSIEVDIMRIGLQLYTVRDETERDFVGTLERIADMGYEGVELAGYGGLSPDEMKNTLSRLGLAAVGSHISLEQLTDNLDEHIKMNLAIGSSYLICPWLPKEQYDSLEALDVTMGKLKQAAERLQSYGLRLGYHNHDFEFTTMVEGKTVFERIFDALPASLLIQELDVCWVQYSGNKPVEWMEKYAERLPLVHFKDLARTPEGAPITVELGKGELDLTAIAKAASNIGAEWLIVEQDVTQRGSLESVEASLGWITANLKGLN